MTKENCALLKEFFRLKDLTQYDLAKMFGTSQAYIAALMNGRTNFGMKTAARFHEKFGLSVGWLVTGEGAMMADGTNPVSRDVIINRAPAQAANTANPNNNSNEATPDNEVKELFKELTETMKDLRKEIQEVKIQLDRQTNEKCKLLDILTELTGKLK